MPFTITREKIEELEQTHMIQEKPLVQSYLTKIKEMQDLELLMSEEEQAILQQVLYQKNIPSSVQSKNDILTVDVVSQLLGISPQMVRRKCSNGLIKAFRTSGDSGEWRIYSSQYLNDPRYSSRLQEILQRIATRKERKQKVLSTLKELSEMQGYTEMFDDIVRSKDSDND